MYMSFAVEKTLIFTATSVLKEMSLKMSRVSESATR